MKEIHLQEGAAWMPREEAEGAAEPLYRVRRVVRVHSDGSCEEKSRQEQEKPKEKEEKMEDLALQWLREEGSQLPQGLSLTCQCPGPARRERVEKGESLPSPPLPEQAFLPEKGAFDHFYGISPWAEGQQTQGTEDLAIKALFQRGAGIRMEEEGIFLQKGTYLVLVCAQVEGCEEEGGLALLMENEEVPGGLWQGSGGCFLSAVLSIKGGRLRLCSRGGGRFWGLSLTILSLEH